MATLALALSALHNKIKKVPIKNVVQVKRKEQPSPNVCSTCTITDYTWRHRLTLSPLRFGKSWIFCLNQGGPFGALAGAEGSILILSAKSSKLLLSNFLISYIYADSE